MLEEMSYADIGDGNEVAERLKRALFEQRGTGTDRLEDRTNIVDAIIRISDLLQKKPPPGGILSSQSRAATGTDDLPVGDCNYSSQTAAQCDTLRTYASNRRRTLFEGDSQKVLQIEELCEDLRDNASEDESIPGRTRTCNLWIRSPLLYPVELRGLSLVLKRFRGWSVFLVMSW